MNSVRYVGASTQGRVCFTLFLCLCVAVYFFSDIFDFIYSIPDARLQRLEAVDLRNFLNALISTGFLLGTACYVTMVAATARRHMQFPYPEMNLPVQLRTQVIEKPSTIWLVVAVLFLSVAFQLIVLWYTWYKWHQLLLDVSSELY